MKAYAATHHKCNLNIISGLGGRIEEFYARLRGEARGLLILSTCNRFEVYVDSPSASFKSILEDIAGEASSCFEEFEGLDAVRHLIEVAAGLDSQIIGEHEILRQVRESWSQARRIGASSRVLDQVVSRALRAARRVRRETRVSYGVVGYPQAGVELLSLKLGGLNGKRVMIVGAGQAGEAALRHLCKKFETRRVIIANRSIDKALALRPLCVDREVHVIGLDGVLSALADVDAVFVAISGGVRLLSASDVESSRSIIVDISLPPVVEHVPGRVFYMDDVKAIADESLRVRLSEVPKAREIIEEELAKIRLFLERIPAEIMISDIMKKARELYKREVTRAGRGGRMLSANELELILDSYTRKILRPLLLFMRSRVYNGDTGILRDIYSFYVGELERMMRSGCRRVSSSKA